MDTYEIDPIKIEKEKAMRRYQTFRKIATIIRTLEIIIAISLTLWSISRSSVYIPIAINFTGDILRRIISLLFSPHFVFLIGNLIVFTLFLNSGHHSGGELHSPVEREDREEEIITIEKKKEMKCYRRTKSEVKAVVVKEEVKKELRRSETEPCQRIANEESESEAVMSERLRRRLFDEDELSGEEFRRKVEEFIDKQQRFLREESKAVIVSSNNYNYNNNQCNSM